MPIIINGQTIRKINGPSTMVCLKPNRNVEGDNYIVLFGDIHTEDRFQHCFNELDCVELIQEFVPILNDYAKNMRTDFYVERFMSDYLLENKNVAHNTNIFEKTQQILEFMHDIKELAEVSPNTGKKVLQQRKNELIKKFNRDLVYVREHQPSNLTHLSALYKPCFYHEKYKDKFCKYKNIKWQFGDPRQMSEKGKNFNILNFTTDMSNFQIFYQLFVSNEKITQDDLDELFYLLDNAKTTFPTIKMCASDSPEFVRRIYASQLMQNQLTKMSSAEREIYTEESFHELASLYFVQMFEKYDRKQLFKILDVLLVYSDIYDKSGSFDAKFKPMAQELLKMLNGIKLSPELALQYYYIPLGMVCIILDMYFILRINKREYGNLNKKLVVGYFGVEHVNKIQHYLVNIVKTHDVEFEFDSTDQPKVTSPLRSEDLPKVASPLRSEDLPKVASPLLSEEDERSSIRRIHIADTTNIDLDAFASSGSRSRSRSERNSKTRRSGSRSGSGSGSKSLTRSKSK